MKRIIYIAFLCCMAANAFTAESELGEVSDLIQENLFRNADKIEAVSGSLTEVERRMLYGQYEKNSQLPFVLNIALGFGLGSFIQGDTAGAVIALAGDTLGLALPLLGYACLMQNYYGYWSFTGGYELMYAGYAVLGITRVFESIRPFVFAKRYNTTLRRSLGLGEGLRVSLLPSFGDGLADGDGFTLNIGYSL